MSDGKLPLKQQSAAKLETGSAISDLQSFVGIAICVFAGTLLFYKFGYSLHHDLAGSALSGRLAITLGDSFRDYSIYFPPVEKLWFTIAAYLSKMTGLPLNLAVVAMTNIIVLFGAGLAYHIRRVTVGCSPLFLILSVLILIILPILFKNVFGLREHLVVVGLWPYLVLRFSDPDDNLTSRRLRVLTGLWMGTMLLFKYLYSMVVILVELTEALMKRRPMLLFRVENILAGMIVFLYLFTWLGTDSSQREAIGAMLSAIDANMIDPNEVWLKLVENSFPAILLLIFSRYSSVPRRSTAIALAVLIATLFASWAQERWYTHHLFPITMAYIIWWWVAAQHFRWQAKVAVGLIILLPIGMQFLSTRVYQEQFSELEQALEDEGLSVAGKRVAILTMHPSPYNQYLASHDGFRWNPMMNNAYVSAELKPFDKEGAADPPPVKLDDPGRRMLHEQMLRLWEDMPPDALILDSTHRWPLRFIDVDWLHAFSKDPRFNAILKDYRAVTTYDGRRMKFTYYVRAD